MNTRLVKTTVLKKIIVKTKIIKPMALGFSIISSLAFMACTSEPSLQTGPNAEISHDGLTRVDNTRVDAAWVRADIDLSQYDKVILKGAEIQYKPVKNRGGTEFSRSNQTEFPLTDQQKQRLQAVVKESFQTEFARSSRFKVANEPGPNTLLVLGTLVDVVSNVPPESAGRTDYYLSTVGAGTLVLEVYDSDSGAILMRAADRDAAGDGNQSLRYSNPVSNKMEVTRVTDRWARWLRESLESLAKTQPM